MSSSELSDATDRIDTPVRPDVVKEHVSQQKIPTSSSTTLTVPIDLAKVKKRSMDEPIERISIISWMLNILGWVFSALFFPILVHRRMKTYITSIFGLSTKETRKWQKVSFWTTLIVFLFFIFAVSSLQMGIKVDSFLNGLAKFLLIIISIFATIMFALITEACVNIFTFLIVYITKKPQRIYYAAVKWLGSVLMGVLMFLTIWGLINRTIFPMNGTVENIHLYYDNLPSELEGFKMMHLTDMHIDGLYGSTHFLNELDREIDRVQPDMIVNTGDFFDTTIERIRAVRGFHATFSRNITYGHFYSLGNHEFIHDEEATVKYVQTTNITPLRDESVLVPISGNVSMQLVGVDYTSSSPAVNKSKIPYNLTRDPDSSFSVLLYHAPVDPLWTMARDKMDLMIMGHTHSGQFLPVNLWAKLAYPRLRGMFKEGRCTYYVSNGGGSWLLPLRHPFITQAQIPVYILHNKV
ncbi:hypothetical protein PCE1_000508 [Barthelona sp. PCE]